MSPTDTRRCDVRVSRRSVLASGASALAGGAAVAAGARPSVGEASAQITQTAVIQAPERWSDANLAGFMIHLGGGLSPETADSIPDCDIANWPPDEAYAYDATIINRKDADTPQAETTLYLDSNVDTSRGELFVVNTFTRCDTDYVGVDLERIGRRFRGTATGPHVDIEDDRRPNEETEGDGDGGGDGAMGPGFGALEAALAAAGLGGLAAWRRTG